MTRAFRTAFVTGASSGLGAAVATELGRRGARVVLAARRAELLQRVAADVRAAGGEAEVCPLDVRDGQAAARAVREWDERLGGLELVLANAGVAHRSARGAQSPEEVARVLNTNLTGAAVILAAALPGMLARGRGTLAAMSSLAGLRGMPGSGAYSASKAGLSTFVESLQADLRGTGVRAVDIQPGFVRTPMTTGVPFRMPFLWEADAAARRIVRGLERGRLTIAFPWQLSWPLRVLARPLPRAVWVRLAARRGGLHSKGSSGS